MPLKIIGDNGPPFTLCELKGYFLKHSIQHQKITPLWPQANGEIECFMQPFTEVIHAAHIERKDWVAALHEFVFVYRVTRYSSTNIPPADLIFQHCIRCFIPDAANKLNHIDLEEKLEFNDQTKKELATDYTALRRHAKSCSLSVGNCVLVKQPRKITFSIQTIPILYHCLTGLDVYSQKLGN